MSDEEKTEMEIKDECIKDLNLVMDIVKESNHDDGQRIIESLETIEEFCDRWWEV